MTTDYASAERQREYRRWVIRREVIEECAGVLEELKGRAHIDEAHYQAIGWAQEAILALKEVSGGPG